ncbi:MAG: hypothetical protein KAT65_10550 [Methanophagales archaeon]|uniref:Uncharacterized protein n=1 Tax=Candidatus Methanophaga sp. ANME-1 ERB7 TaxID=2759913 RepID=A0A7G9Z3S5_9EURY|nr:hypothetical protein [Methanophagales archaeon]QNO54909.1 hypothetical protein PADEGAKA_00011 [Methanosarcinales archaeon ANME-1 ERB7]
MKLQIKPLIGILIIAIILISGCVLKEISREKVPEKGEEAIPAVTEEIPTVPEEKIPAPEKEKIAKLELTKLESVIEMECAEGIVNYKETSLWNKRVENGKFKEEQIEKFKDSIRKYNVKAKDCLVELKGSSAILSCAVYGSFQHTRYDFDWFLRPLNLDFLDNHFERKEKELYWEGKVAKVKTIISIKFPYPISNCHEHVWKRR